MVPGAGLEPARSYDRGILNPLCLPISPPGQRMVAVTTALFVWRRNPESNRDPRICNPLHSHSAIPPYTKMVHVAERQFLKLERETRLELATPTLARLCSTN